MCSRSRLYHRSSEGLAQVEGIGGTMEQPNCPCHVHGGEMRKLGLSESVLFEPNGKPHTCWVYSGERCTRERKAEDHHYVLLQPP